MARAFFVLITLFLLGSSGLSYAVDGRHSYTPDYRDVLRDSNGNPVRSTSGACVRTNWLNDYDACYEEIPRTRYSRTEHLTRDSVTQEDRSIYFEFDKATLTPAAKAKLDALASHIRSQNDVRGALVVGFADRIGTASYNEKLSQKRAQNVRKYLESRNVLHSHVGETRWYGESAPVSACSDDMSRQKLIECLQKDRRVEVEINYGSDASDNE